MRYEVRMVPLDGHLAGYSDLRLFKRGEDLGTIVRWRREGRGFYVQLASGSHELTPSNCHMDDVRVAFAGVQLASIHG